MSNTLPPISEEELARGLPKRKIGFMTWAILSLLTLVGLPMLAYFSWVATSRQRFERRMAELVENGVPVTADDMLAMYVIPDSAADSTALYMKAMQVLSSEQYGTDSNGIELVSGNSSSPPTPETNWNGLAYAQGLLEDYTETLADLHKAAELGGAAVYPVEFNDGFGATLEHAQNLRLCVRLLRLEAYVHAHNGNSNDVAKSIVAGLAAACSLEYEPFIVSQMVSISLVQKNLETLERLQPHVNFADDELAQLQAAVRRIDFQARMQHAFNGEQAMCMVALADADREQLAMTGMEDRALYEAWILSKLGSRFDDLMLLTECMEQMLAALDKPWPDAILDANKIANDTLKNTEGPISERRFGLTRACLKVPYFPTIPLQEAAMVEAKLRMTDALLAARRFHLARSKKPDNLEQLVPDFIPSVPLDPYAPDRPLRLFLLGGKVRISSVGLAGSSASPIVSTEAADEMTDTGSIEVKFDFGTVQPQQNVR